MIQKLNNVNIVLLNDLLIFIVYFGSWSFEYHFFMYLLFQMKVYESETNSVYGGIAITTQILRFHFNHRHFMISLRIPSEECTMYNLMIP